MKDGVKKIFKKPKYFDDGKRCCKGDSYECDTRFIKQLEKFEENPLYMLLASFFRAYNAHNFYKDVIVPRVVPFLVDKVVPFLAPYIVPALIVVGVAAVIYLGIKNKDKIKKGTKKIKK